VRHVFAATSSRLGPAGGSASPRPPGGTRWWDHGAMSSRWCTRQTFYDDLVLLFYDDPFVFVIILRAKAPSLVTNDEPTKFVIECSHSMMKFLIVTAESSLMNTFLVVIPVRPCSCSTRSRGWPAGFGGGRPRAQRVGTRRSRRTRRLLQSCALCSLCER
jgi:hypothetical protein